MTFSSKFQLTLLSERKPVLCDVTTKYASSVILLSRVAAAELMSENGGQISPSEFDKEDTILFAQNA